MRFSTGQGEQIDLTEATSLFPQIWRSALDILYFSPSSFLALIIIDCINICRCGAFVCMVLYTSTPFDTHTLMCVHGLYSSSCQLVYLNVRQFVFALVSIFYLSLMNLPSSVNFVFLPALFFKPAPFIQLRLPVTFSFSVSAQLSLSLLFYSTSPLICFSFSKPSLCSPIAPFISVSSPRS